LRTKGGNDWSKRYPLIGKALLKLPVDSIDFDALHSRLYDDHAPLLAFDLFELDGEDLRGLPLLEQKLRLKRLLGRKGATACTTSTSSTATAPRSSSTPAASSWKASCQSVPIARTGLAVRRLGSRSRTFGTRRSDACSKHSSISARYRPEP
jgi:hypothetical protein